MGCGTPLLAPWHHRCSIGGQAGMPPASASGRERFWPSGVSKFEITHGFPDTKCHRYPREPLLGLALRSGVSVGITDEYL